MDIDGEGAASTQTLNFSGLDIAGLTNLQFSIDVAEDDDAANQDWDADTALRIEYSIDGGAFQNLLAFEATGGTNTEPALDTDFDGIGDGTTLTNLFQTFSAAIAGTGSTLDIRITFENLDAGDEDAAIDNIVITGDSTGGTPDPRPGAFSVDDIEIAEGDSGATEFTFTVSRTGGSDGEVTVDYFLSGVTANTADFADVGNFTGTLVFADGETTKTITFLVNGDTVIEDNETFNVGLTNATGGATIDDGLGVATILNDDFPPQGPAEVFVNEIHYDNSSGDVGEAIEIAGRAGTDLTGWTIALYNGNGGGVYDTISLSGIIPDQDDGYGTLSFTRSGIQNGPDAIALVDTGGNVVQFLSYEGTITATDGPAFGLTSDDIGVAEDGGTPAGFSLQLTGTGTFYSDFTWEAPRADNFGAVNIGQDFVAANPAGTLFIDDAQVVEGDSGSTQITFNIFRAGGSTGVVEFNVTPGLTGLGLGDASTDDFSPVIQTISLADGETFATVTINVFGDTTGEANETFAVLLTDISGGASVGDGEAIGTILNDDPLVLQIGEIQGAGHTSVWVGNEVSTSGIVTAVADNGFYLQDPDGDGDSATSDAIFVFTGSAPTVVAGDAIDITATVGEFQAGGDPGNLSVTQLSNATSIVVTSSSNALPAAVVIGPDGITPPTETIEDDNFANFDPLTDGIDFWESLEGMLVTVQNPVAVDQTNGFGELWTVASDGEGGLVGSNISDEGLLVIDGGDGGLGVFDAGAGSDFNPERIQIDSAGPLNGVDFLIPDVDPGARLADVTGVINYSFGNFELRPTEAVTVAAQSTNIAEMTTLVAGAQNELSVATYNVLNLDINDADGDDDVASGRLDAVAFDIGVNLQAPDIVVLQEVQDDSGSANDGTVSAQLTLQALADAIFAETGVHYSVFDNPFVVDGQTGGQPGGNIRVAFLYRDDRVDLDEASVFTITDGSTGELDAAFLGSRAPLGANFTFNGETVTVIGNHFTSKIGSENTFSGIQPPTNAGALARAAQAAALNAYIDGLLASNPNARIAVAGDFNEFQFEEPMEILTGELDFVGGTVEAGTEVILQNLTYGLAVDERYSVLFQGNAQQLDHILATANLADGARIDAVHTNTTTGFRASDHDPILALFTVGAVTISGTSGADRIEGTDSDEDINASSGNDIVNGNGGDDNILGGSGADILFGGEGDDTINGGSGNDVVGGGSGADILTGGSGFTTFVVEAGKSEADADIITDFSYFDRLAIADADGLDFVIQQNGANTEVIADGVLVVTLLNTRASRVVNNIEYEGNPASIDAPAGTSRGPITDGPFDFDGFGAPIEMSGSNGGSGPSPDVPTRTPSTRGMFEDWGLGIERGQTLREFDNAFTAREFASDVFQSPVGMHHNFLDYDLLV